MRYPYLPDDEIECAADALLTQAFGREIPVPVDLDAVLFDVLAETEQLAFNDESVLGDEDGDQILGRMWPFRNQIEICASLKTPHSKGRLKGRYRFTVCHEVGHWRLHRPLHLRARAERSDGLFDTEDTQFHMVSLNRNIFSNVKPPPEEVQANRFAAHLLIPGPLLRREFQRRFGQPQVVTDPGSTAYETATELAHRTTRGISTSLCDAFEVSRQAMAIALDSRGYVTDEPTFL